SSRWAWRSRRPCPTRRPKSRSLHRIDLDPRARAFRPPGMTRLMRTEYCGNTDTRFLGKTVTRFGWAHRRRDHGGVIFIDLRDREGLVQVVCDPDRAETFAIADRVRNEYVLRVQGVVRRRPEGTVNPSLRSGEIEVLAHELEILNPAAPLPFMVDEEHLSEEVRLKYRYLDLRREPMQRALKLRHAVARATRGYLDA